MIEGNLFGWSDATWQLLDQFGILLGDVLMVLSVAAAVAGWLRRDRIRHWFRRNVFPEVGGVVAPGESGWDGLLFTVSHKEVPRWVMEQVQPRAVAFVCSARSQAAAEALSEYARAHGMRPLMLRIVDPDDPSDARRGAAACLDALREAGCTRIAADITGGKLPMSLGAFMAAEEAGADTLYVTAEYDRDLRRVRTDTARVIRISSGGK